MAESKPIETPKPATEPEAATKPPKRVAKKAQGDGVGAGLIVVGVLSIVLLIFAAGVILARRGKRKRMASNASREEGAPFAEAEDPGRPDPESPIGVDAFGSDGALSAGV